MQLIALEFYAKLFWSLGSLILIVLGGVHIYLVLFTDKFLSRDEKVVNQMKESHLILTRKTTLWKAWIGFNISHGIGLIFVGLLNLFFAYRFVTRYQDRLYLFAANFVMIGIYLWLAKKYWFKTPFIGLVITGLCFLTAFALLNFNR